MFAPTRSRIATTDGHDCTSASSERQEWTQISLRSNISLRGSVRKPQRPLNGRMLLIKQAQEQNNKPRSRARRPIDLRAHLEMSNSNRQASEERNVLLLHLQPKPANKPAHRYRKENVRNKCRTIPRFKWIARITASKGQGATSNSWSKS